MKKHDVFIIIRIPNAGSKKLSKNSEYEIADVVGNELGCESPARIRMTVAEKGLANQLSALLPSPCEDEDEDEDEH